MKWQTKAAAVLAAVLGIGLVAVLAQAPNVLFEATFDEGIEGAISAEKVELRPVSTRVPEQQAALVEPGGSLTYAAEGNISLTRGAVEFGVQPLAPVTDNENHYYFCLGDPDEPNALVVWKTQLYNDLRFRINAADGQHMDAILPDLGSWVPTQWHHIIAAWDMEKGWLRLYVDGSQRALRPAKGVELGPLPERFAVGSDLGGQGNAAAVVDELRIHDRPPQGRQPEQWHERFLTGERSSGSNPWQGTVDTTSLALLPEPDLTFVAISDPHISKPGQVGRYSHNHRVVKLVEQMNAMKPAFVLDAGDIVTTFPGREDFDACAQRSLEIFKALEVPVYHAPGNHDVGNKLQITYSGNPGPDDVYKRGWYVNDDNLADYRRYFGPDWFSFDHSGCHFIVINNALLNSGLPDEAKQFEWLKADLEAAKDSRLTFVAVHNPLFWVGTDDVGTENYELVNEPMRGEVLDLFDEYDVHAVFTGHTHHRISNYLRGTKYLTLPSTTFARNFGGSYGLPGMKVVWDPERVGYYVVRVYGQETRINLVRTYAPLPPMEPMQEGNDAPRVRALGKKSADIAAGDFGLKSAPPPSVQRGIWHVMGIADGVKPGDCSPETVPAHCWTSNVHAFDDQDEWLEVRLPEAKAITEIVFYPRPGNFGFPLDFTVKTTADGQTWEDVAKREGFRAPPDATETGVRFPLDERRKVLGARLEMTRLSDTDHNNIRAAMMEVALLDEAGTDVALEALGATADSGTKVGGDRKTVDDHFFAEPTQVGAKWVVLPEEAVSPQAVQPSPGRFVLSRDLQRAFTLGKPPGLRFVVPLTPDPAGGVESFRSYARFLMESCPPDSAYLMLPPEGAADAMQQALVSLRGELAPDALLLVSAEPAAPAIDGVVTRLTLDGAPEAAFAGPFTPANWIELDAWKSSDLDETARAKLLARAMVLAKAEGVPLIHWAAPGELGAILNSLATPEPPMFAFRSVATLLSGASAVPVDEIAAVSGETDKVEVRVFRAADGAMLVVLWQPVEPGAQVQPARLRVRPNGAVSEAQLVDCLTCTMQEAVVEQQDGRATVDGLQVRDYPLVVRFSG